MPGDPPDLAQGRLDLRAAVIAQPLGKPGRDGVLLVVPGADDERETEFGLVFRVGLLEPGDLFVAEAIRVETGGALLGGRFPGERAGQGCSSHEVGMRPDQGELALLAGAGHDLQQRRVERSRVRQGRESQASAAIQGEPSKRNPSRSTNVWRSRASISRMGHVRRS